MGVRRCIGSPAQRSAPGKSNGDLFKCIGSLTAARPRMRLGNSKLPDILKIIPTKLFLDKHVKPNTPPGLEADSHSPCEKQERAEPGALTGVQVVEGTGDDAEWAMWEREMRRARGEPIGAPHVLESNPQFKLVQQSFAHIADRLMLVWGYKEFRVFMDGLLHDNRDGTRKAFPAAVLFALHALSEEHDEQFPSFCAKGDRWTSHLDALQRKNPFKP
jgi:hypothetical protein